MPLFQMFRRKNKDVPVKEVAPRSTSGEEYFCIENEDPRIALKKYQEVDDFFAEHIADPTKNHLTGTMADQRGDNLVLVAMLGQTIVGALWAGPPHAEADDAVVRGQRMGKEKQMKSLANDMKQRSLMLHNMAVTPEFRRRGIGRELLLLVIEEANDAGKDLLWGVASPEAVDFYSRTPLKVAPNQGILTIANSPKAVYGLPLVGESRWVYCQLRQVVPLQVGFRSQI
ncbi:GNAT family N-acetyltransferase [Glutamicibacter ardleyensis]|uniref:GNAT family N-acetyltransferase n=1 Tax=Glutamicibacter ardleyensis TaxID=225894 RepID=UPI003FD38D0D